LGIGKDHGFGDNIGATGAIALGAGHAHGTFLGFLRSCRYGIAQRHINAVLKLLIQQLARILHPAHLNGDQTQQSQTGCRNHYLYSIRFHKGTTIKLSQKNSKIHCKMLF